jgi:hypothetical protein
MLSSRIKTLLNAAIGIHVSKIGISAFADTTAISLNVPFPFASDVTDQFPTHHRKKIAKIPERSIKLFMLFKSFSLTRMDAYCLLKEYDSQNSARISSTCQVFPVLWVLIL